MNKELYVLPVALGKKSKVGLNGDMYGIPISDAFGYPLPSMVINRYITNFLVLANHLPDYNMIIEDRLLSYMRKHG